MNDYLNATAQELIAALFQLAMTQKPNGLDIFMSIAGHVKSVQVLVIKGATYKEGENQNILLNVTIRQRSDIFTQELRTALSDVLAIISQHNIQGAA